MKKSQQRRWRDVPKDELDAIRVSRSGKPELMTKEERKAAENEKKNRNLQSKRKALAKKK